MAKKNSETSKFNAGKKPVFGKLPVQAQGTGRKPKFLQRSQGKKGW